MLDMDKVQQMTDVIHTSISYSGIEHAVISTPIYNRLHRVLQSSLVFLTYPSNKVKRFEHSVGVMHLAGNIFYNSICNASPDVLSQFMNDVENEITSWRNQVIFDTYVSKELRQKYKKRDILSAPYPKSEFYNKFQPGNLEKNKIFSFLVVFQAVRLAGLLHDVGHLPYSHILEHALKKMYACVKSKENKSLVEIEFINIMKRFAEGNDEIHEEIGKLLVHNIRESIVQNIEDTTNEILFFFMISFDFAEKIISSAPTDNNIFSALHFITASVLDADRLDYCSRDSFCSGTNKSIFSYDRLLTTYRLNRIVDDGKEKYFFCPSFKAVSTIEELLSRRYSIFSEINFHHRVHKHEILLEEVITTLGLDELEHMKEIEDLPHTLPLEISSIWKLISKLDAGNDWPEYQIIQLDDSWLDTLLKHKFFDKYKENYLSVRENHDKILWHQFDELISSTKRYYSLLKRSNDFREFDKKFFINIKSIINENKEYFKDFAYSEIIERELYNDFYELNHSFVFNYILEKICASDAQKNIFFSNLEAQINSDLPNSGLNIQHCILRSCVFSFGYKTTVTPLYLSDSKNNWAKIEQVSSQLQSFQKQRSVAPLFHFYYLPEYGRNFNIENVNREHLIDFIAKKTAILFKNVDKLELTGSEKHDNIIS